MKNMICKSRGFIEGQKTKDQEWSSKTSKRSDKLPAVDLEDQARTNKIKLQQGRFSK